LNAILLPPGINILLISVGLLTLKRFRRVAISLLVFACGSLLLISMPVVSNQLLHSLETTSVITNNNLKSYQLLPLGKTAIVVLSGGRQTHTPEYGSIDTVSATSLQRLKYAAWLHKKIDLPILLSGGSRFNEATSEAVLMNQVMLSSFSIAPKWIESFSKTTAENASFASQILHKNNVSEIILITHALHMPRAKLAFEKQGLKVIGAPIAFYSNTKRNYSLSDYLPNFNALHKSSLALHEMLALIWYKVRY
jgi:uncharacterized SAM-binding protein YcdF (DUF218 family)